MSQEVTQQEIISMEGYEDIANPLKSDCWALGDALVAQHSSVSYIPEVGWLFIIENAGQFDFEKMATAVKENLISLDLLLARKQIANNTKMFISFKVILADDYILVFNAEDLSNTEKWKVYKGER